MDLISWYMSELGLTEDEARLAVYEDIKYWEDLL